MISAGAPASAGLLHRSRGSLQSVGESLWRDLRDAVRALVDAPSFTTIAVLCLAIGIGANTVMFGIADRLFLRPPPGVRDYASVVRLYLERRVGSIRAPDGGPGSFPDYQDLHAGQLHGFSSVAAYSAGQFGYGSGPSARRLKGQHVSASYFTVLGTRPAVGRFFLPEEDTVAGSHPVVVVSYGLWQREFGGDPHVIGRVIKVDGQPVTIIGVTERGFSGFDLQPLDVWAPITDLHGAMGPGALTQRHAIWVNMVARVAVGATPLSAAAEATALKRRIDATVAPDLDKTVHVVTGPLLEATGTKRGSQATIALWVTAAVGLVLLIACANVANLAMARGTRRRRELAIRLSLGASRWQLIRLLVVESVVLALGGGAGGLVLSVWGTGIGRLFGLPPAAAGVDARILIFTGAVSLTTALLFGVVPALSATRVGIGTSLKDGALHSSQAQSRTQTTLLVLQAALSLVVLAGAGLFVRSLRNMQAIDLGMDVRHVVLASVDLESSGYDSAARIALNNRAIERLSALPGVKGASTEGVPPFRGLMAFGIAVPGLDSAAIGSDDFSTNFVGPEFLRANGTPLRRGRDISAQDRAGARPVAVINETMARRLWPAEDPIGKCIKVPTGPGSEAATPCTWIVGVMADGRYLSMTEKPMSYFLLPYAQRSMGWQPTLVVRGTDDAARLAADVRRAMLTLAPDLPYVDVRPIAEELDPQLQPYRIGAVLFSVFGLVALGLAAVGLYGVVSYIVAQRTREAGVRLALGARGVDVLALMLRRGMMPAVVGAAIGVCGALVVTRMFRSQLYGVSPTDPLTFAGVGLLLCAVAACACYFPARRAARIDPVTALRSE